MIHMKKQNSYIIPQNKKNRWTNNKKIKIKYKIRERTRYQRISRIKL